MSVMRTFLLTSVALGSVACSFQARSPERYRDDTRALLESRGPQLQSCYRDALEATNETTGSVIVHFTVEHETGSLTALRVDEKSTGSEPLRACVLKALEGLTLTPPDARDGVATFRYEFEPEA